MSCVCQIWGLEWQYLASVADGPASVAVHSWQKALMWRKGFYFRRRRKGGERKGKIKKRKTLFEFQFVTCTNVDQHQQWIQECDPLSNLALISQCPSFRTIRSQLARRGDNSKTRPKRRAPRPKSTDHRARQSSRKTTIWTKLKSAAKKERDYFCTYKSGEGVENEHFAKLSVSLLTVMGRSTKQQLRYKGTDIQTL